MHEEFVQTPFILVVAGPNGVGKSTFTQTLIPFLAEGLIVVDPDMIERELPSDFEGNRAIHAARLANEQMDSLIINRSSFIVETTLSGKLLAPRLLRAAENGFRIEIIFLLAPSVNVTLARVHRRVTLGGHDIPLSDQLRRFDRCYENFHHIYRKVCHEWSVYYAEQDRPRLFDWGSGGLTPDGTDFR